MVIKRIHYKSSPCAQLFYQSSEDKTIRYTKKEHDRVLGENLSFLPCEARVKTQNPIGEAKATCFCSVYVASSRSANPRATQWGAQGRETRGIRGDRAQGEGSKESSRFTSHNCRIPNSPHTYLFHLSRRLL